MIPNTTQRGYLLLADISGYTSYVGGTEFEHSQDVVSFFLRFQLFRLWKFESIEGLMLKSPEAK